MTTSSYLTTNYEGVLQRPDGRSVVVLNDGGCLGPFQDALSAALARDIELIRRDGLNQPEQLNFPQYAVFLIPSDIEVTQ